MANIRSARRSGFVLRGGVKRRETFWIASSVIVAAPAAASTAILLSTLNAAVLAVRPFTIVRTIGELFTRSD